MPKVARNAVDQKLKARIASVAKTGKLTDAMRLVAAAKIRRAQEGVEQSRPFSDELQSMIKGLVKKLKGTGLEATLPMLRTPEKVKGVAILSIFSNRGLCGGFNAFVGKRTAFRVADLNKQGITPKIVLVGKKGPTSIKRKLDKLKYEIVEKRFLMSDRLTSGLASEISDELQNLFLSGEVDKVEIVYTKFFNLLKSEPSLRSMLPLSPVGIEDPEDETFKLTSDDGKLSAQKTKVKSAKAKDIENDVIFDQTPESILNSMLPLYLTSQILSLMFESQASELAARMAAMKSATDNAKDIVKKLTLTYNKARQAAITQELCEISAACNALEEADAGGPKALGYGEDEDAVTAEFLQEVDDGALPSSPVFSSD